MPTQEMTVLSVRQPWASLLLTGEDWCENRSWNTKYRGPLWIHASSKIETGECNLWGIDKSKLTTSAILGCVELVDVFHIDDLERRLKPIAQKYPLNEDVGASFVVGDYCWIVVNPQVLKTPIPCHGKLNLWKYQADTSQVQDLMEAKPLIDPEFFPEPTPIEEAEITVDGKVEPISFIIDQWIDIYFPDRDETREAAFPEDEDYIHGPPHFRAACELAWELFPDDFVPGVHDWLQKRKK
ncbi:MAG: ASCH domain-containing protein [Planctomycetaceae bacterium]|nr:ASCH domain-containing protein [Planctomycetaceae bacterium]